MGQWAGPRVIQTRWSVIVSKGVTDVGLQVYLMLCRYGRYGGPATPIPAWVCFSEHLHEVQVETSHIAVGQKC